MHRDFKGFERRIASAGDPDSPAFWVSPRLAGAQGASAAHGFFGRLGGVSEGVYTSLNCGLGSGDKMAHALQNRRKVARALGAQAERLLTAHQVHGDTCVTLHEAFDPVHGRPQADALATAVPGLALGVLTADCAPVLLHGTREDGSPVIAAAHAGWRGAVKGVLESALRAMTQLGASADTVCAAIGPCIGKRSYEVGPEFYEEVLRADEEAECFFGAAGTHGYHHFDVGGYCALRLRRAGAGRVDLADMDTYAQERHFFSFRRTTHRKEEDYGRQISAIMIL